MSAEPVNLADPDFEPSDEQLAGLMARAFAGVSAANEAALARMREEIAVRSQEVLRKLREQQAGKSRALP